MCVKYSLVVYENFYFLRQFEDVTLMLYIFFFVKLTY